MTYAHPIDGTHVLALALGFAFGASFIWVSLRSELDRLRRAVRERRVTRIGRAAA